jgi:hypothetical protein
VAQIEVRVGDYHVGVRTNALEVRERLTEVLSHLLVADPTVRASYAVYGSSDKSGERRTYSVYYDCNRIRVTRSLDRAVAVVIAQLEQHLPRPVHPAHVVEVDSSAILAVNDAVLVPWALPYFAPATEFRLEKNGLRLYEGASVWIDTDRREVVIPQRRLLTQAGAAVLPAAALTEPGRRTLSCWVFLGRPEHSGADLSRAGALARALGFTYRHHTLAANLQALAHLLAGLEVLAVDEIHEIAKTARSRLQS